VCPRAVAAAEDGDDLGIFRGSPPLGLSVRLRPPRGRLSRLSVRPGLSFRLHLRFPACFRVRPCADLRVRLCAHARLRFLLPTLPLVRLRLCGSPGGRVSPGGRAASTPVPVSPPAVPPRPSLSSLLSVLAVLVLGVSGCSLVSGWSDLQNGSRVSSDSGIPPTTADSGATTTDSGTIPSGSHDSGTGADSSAAGNDAGGNDSAAPVLTTVVCGATTRCLAGQACCAGFLGQSSQCQASSQACNPPSALVSCSDSSACTVLLGHAAQCCTTPGTTPGITTVASVSCRTTCAAGDAVVCDPTAATSDCPSGTTCQASPDGYPFDTCQ
jgi:hypothetical protein